MGSKNVVKFLDCLGDCKFHSTKFGLSLLRYFYYLISKHTFNLHAKYPLTHSLAGLDLLYEVLRSHSDTSHSVGLLWMSEQPHAETSTSQHTTLTTDRPPCPPPEGFEPTIPASERP